MTYYSQAARGGETARIDLRSDTVTRPTDAMRAAMAAARVGDDVYGDDETVNALQQRVAQLLDKEAALFMTSGTQSNLCAMLAHCQRGEEVLTGEGYHVFANEAGGASVLGGVMMAPLATDARGALSAEVIAAAVKPDDPHCPVSRLLCLENTISGYAHGIEQINDWAAEGRRHGLRVHLDGARLFNAVVALEGEVTAMVRPADSVSLCLSKGLGAPAGSVLVGERDFIARARRIRKMLGGGLRQAGILAAAGLYALAHHIERLADDHALARELAGQLAAIPQLTVQPQAVESNMVFVDLPPPAGQVADKLRGYLSERGILLGGGAPLRLVTHLDIDRAAVETVVRAMREFFD